jgi:hypothetical protein
VRDGSGVDCHRRFLDRLRLVLLPVPLAHFRVADLGQALESLAALRRGCGVVLRRRAPRPVDLALQSVAMEKNKIQYKQSSVTSIKWL